MTLTMTNPKLITDYHDSETVSDLGLKGDFRLEALQEWKKISAPTNKQDDWRYVPVESVLSQSYGILTTTDVPQLMPTRHQIVLVNGIYQEAWSQLPQGISVVQGDVSSKQAFQFNQDFTVFSHNYIHQMAHVLSPNSIQIHVKKGVQLETPIHILLMTTVSDPFIVFPQITWRSEESTSVELIVEHQDESTVSYFENAIFQFDLAENACVKYSNIKSQLSGTVFDGTYVSLQKNARFDSTHIGITSSFIHQSLNVNFKGEGAECYVSGVNVLREQSKAFQKNDFQLFVPECESSQTFKTILLDDAMAEYNGLVYVHQDAQRINSDQLNRNLILSPNAKAYSRPQLRIFADDVSCAHGSTTGQLEIQEIFYLMSRGLSENVAKRLLLFGFAEDIIDNIYDSEFRKEVSRRVSTELDFFAEAL